MSDHKRSLCTPKKAIFWKDFLSLDIQRAITLVKNIYQENILYIYIFTWKFFVFIIFLSLFSLLLFAKKGCLTIFLKGGPLYPAKRPSFFQLCPFCHLFFWKIALEHVFIEILRTFLWFFVVTWVRVNHHNWPAGKESSFPWPTPLFPKVMCTLMYI